MRYAIYARVSTDHQDAMQQVKRLKAWVERQPEGVLAHARYEIASTRALRAGQEEIMALARGHHIHAVAVEKLDRWGRSLIELKTTLDELAALGVHFYSIDQGISLRGKADAATGLFLNILGSFAEFERELISERTKAGMAARKAAGVHVGRPRKGPISKPPQNRPVPSWVPDPPFPIGVQNPKQGQKSEAEQRGGNEGNCGIP